MKGIHLNTLKLQRTRIGDEGAVVLARTYAEHAKLECFEFSTCEKLTNHTIELLGKAADLNTFGGLAIMPRAVGVSMQATVLKRNEIQSTYEKAVKRYDSLDAAAADYVGKREFIKVDNYRDELRGLAKLELTLPIYSYQRKQLALRRKQLVVCEDTSLEKVHCLSKVRVEQFLDLLTKHMHLFLAEPQVDVLTLPEYQNLPKDELTKKYENLLEFSYTLKNINDCTSLLQVVFNVGATQIHITYPIDIKLFTKELKDLLISEKNRYINHIKNRMAKEVHTKVFTNNSHGDIESKYTEFENAIYKQIEIQLDKLIEFAVKAIDDLSAGTISVFETLSELNTTSAATLGKFSGQGVGGAENPQNTSASSNSM